MADGGSDGGDGEGASDGAGGGAGGGAKACGGEGEVHTPDRFKQPRAKARLSQQRVIDKVRKKSAASMAAAHVFKRGELARLRVHDTTVHRTGIAAMYEVVMVLQEIENSHAGAGGRKMYKVCARSGIVEGNYASVEDLIPYPQQSGNDDFPFATVEEAEAVMKDTKVTWMAMAMAGSRKVVSCKCRTGKDGKKCGSACPCRMAKRACSAACHARGTCCNWTTADA